MKTKLIVLLCAVLAVPVLVGGIALAHEGEHAETETETQKTTEVEHHKTGNETMTLQQRSDKYKSEQKTRLTAALKARLKEKCKASQGTAISSLNQRVNGLLTSREQKYGNLLDRLTKLSPKLKEKGIDTTELDKEIAELKTLSDTYLTSLATYNETLSDLKTMDCAADPDAFKAALEAARAARTQAVTNSEALHKYVRETLKPTLTTIREQLKTKEEDN